MSGIYTVLFAYLSYIFVFEGALDSNFNKYTGTNDYLSFVILGGALYAFAVSTLMNVSLVLGSIMLYFRDTYITQNTLFVTMAFEKGKAAYEKNRKYGFILEIKTSRME